MKLLYVLDWRIFLKHFLTLKAFSDLRPTGTDLIGYRNCRVVLNCCGMPCWFSSAFLVLITRTDTLLVMEENS